MVNSLQARTKLLEIEITNNELTNESLETFASSVFPENTGLRKIVLSCNYIGVNSENFLTGSYHNSQTPADAVTFFLEHALIDLIRLEHLDLSTNYLSDDTVEPIATLLFANSSCQMKILNLEHN